MNIINNKAENSNPNSTNQSEQSNQSNKSNNLTLEEKKARLLNTIAAAAAAQQQQQQQQQPNNTKDPKDDSIDMFSSKSDFIPSKEVKSDLAADVAQNDHPEFIVDVAVAGLADTKVDPDSLEITSKMKDKFVESVITGERFTQSYKFLNGKVEVTFRNRSIEEDRAILQNLAYLERIGNIKTRLDYQDRLRISLLASQVATFNDMDFPTLAAPLAYTVDGTDVVPPGWEKQEQFWSAQSPALIVMLIKQLKIFESIYWTLTSKASVENFWKTDTRS
jgi:hypothetical protein